MLEDERSLVAAAKQGDRHAFEMLAERCAPRVYALVYRMVRGRREEAEDLTQETLLRAYASLASFREDSAFSTWLHRIAVNLTLNRLDRKNLVAASLEDDPREVADKDASAQPLAALQTSELRQVLEAAILRLSDSLRVVFVLRELEGLSHDEIARMLDSNSQAIRVRHHRAKKVLMELLAPYVLEGQPR
ncbi:MAG: DNA-directed RNA polymerase sigma-70 factor [Candidatus Xenobia bacterium]